MRCAMLCGCLLLAALPAASHPHGHGSLEENTEAIRARMAAELDHDALTRLDPEGIWDFLDEEERHVLGTHFLTFRVDVPVTVLVAFNRRMAELPQWLADEGFVETTFSVTVGDDPHVVYGREFEAGPVELGYNDFGDFPLPYLTLLAPRDGPATITVSAMSPGSHNATELHRGALAYGDSLDLRVTDFTPALEGVLLVRGRRDRAGETRLLDVFRVTRHPASADPDQIVLTWSDAPATSQTLQWRTKGETPAGAVRYEALDGGDGPATVIAETRTLVDERLLNDPEVHRHRAVLDGLEAATDYRFALGTGDEDGWGPWHTFRTAPNAPGDFSFLYLGTPRGEDAALSQILARAAEQARHAAFSLVPGGFTDGHEGREAWDRLFHLGAPLFAGRPLVPAIGPAEREGGLYATLFALPDNGPEALPPGNAYHFTYGNALFVVLDTTTHPARQADWLDAVLSGSDATWKFAVIHHTAYSTVPDRDNMEIRRHWLPPFEAHGVDLVFQGQDRAYLRTRPMGGGAVQEQPGDGVVYLVATAGTADEAQEPSPLAAHAETGVSTFQVIDIKTDPDRLVYTAYDGEGRVRDTLRIEK